MTFIILRKIVWRRGVENNISFQGKEGEIATNRRIETKSKKKEIK
jgi:hypothetical protein